MKTILFLISALAVGMMADLRNNHAFTSVGGAPEGYSGAPGEGTCTFCHSGPPVTIETVSFTCDVPESGYVPGVTYNVTVALSGGQSNTFGFEASPQDATGELQGTMMAGEGTQLIGDHKWITQTYAGSQGSEFSKTWSFGWTAPPAGTGDLTFYGAFNFASSTNYNLDDVIMIATIPLSEADAVGIDMISEKGYAVFPNPATDHLSIALPIGVMAATATLFDTHGRIVLSERVGILGGMGRLDLGTLPAGVYLLGLEYNGTKRLTKVLVG